MEEYFKCYLTNLIFHDPVVAEDGYIYEFLAIKHWLSKKNVSPRTGEPMGDTLQPVKHFSSLVNKYLEDRVELIEQKFYNKKPYYLFHDEFIGSILKNEFHALTDYTDVLINDPLWGDDDTDTICSYLFVNCGDNDIIKQIIDNSIDYDSDNCRGERPIHLACKFASEDIIEHLINKNVNIDIVDSKGNKPIHYFTKCQNNASNIAKYFIEKDEQSDTYNEDGLLPIHLVSQNMSSWECIKPFIESNHDLEVLSQEGMKPIHYACRDCGSAGLIKKFISLDIDLESCTEDHNNYTCDELIYINEFLSKEEKQKLIYIYLDKMFKKIDIKEDYLEEL